MTDATSIFLVCPPGLEDHAAAEAREAGFSISGAGPGGVEVAGGLAEAVRANVTLRGTVRVLLRIASFRAMHLAQLDKRARKVDWPAWIAPGTAIRVEATCRKSRIYHDRAAAQRIARAVTETAGAVLQDDASLVIKARIDDDLCTLSIDTTGEALHKRGHKQAVNAAPMRETMAALFLRAAGYSPGEPVYDPMCGSGTFPIEAAEIATGLLPGRSRGFAFEALAAYDPAMRPAVVPPKDAPPVFHGSDRDQGAIRMSRDNADRAGVGALCSFTCAPVSEITPPVPEPGLVIVNPPYGARIGNRKQLFGLYGALGARLTAGFSGWRVALVTSDDGLARATGLPFDPPGPQVANGGLRVRLWQTPPLA